MLSNADNFKSLFPEVAQTWDLERLYADFEQINGKPLKPFEKACLRGLLCRYRPGQIAFRFNWTSGALRVELNKGLYRYLEALTDRPLNTLKWDHVGDWLEEKGYKKVEQRNSNQAVSANIIWGEAPEVSSFFGRDEEISDLKQWIVGDRCRQVCIYGIGGIGKTQLAVKLAEQIQTDFDYLIWRSLRYVQPLGLLLADLKQFLPHGTNSDHISNFMEVLGKHRCLIILDDYETILQDGELAGVYRQGCEEYAKLLQRLGAERHQSCLLLISREQPKEIAIMQGETLPVRAYKLRGLKKAGAIALLKTRGFSGAEPGMEQLIQQYRGNPSALKIVGTTIYELFNDNIAEFLKQTALVLGDMLQSLLYGQFERLSNLEKDVLYWLALKRRPTSLFDLKADMQLQTSSSELIDALESLRSRSLIEKVTEAQEILFMLEPVMLKYVNKKFVEEVGKEVEAIVLSQSLSRIRLLESHALVEDLAPEPIRAVQIRLTLKPIKDILGKALHDAEINEDRLNEAIFPKQEQSNAQVKMSKMSKQLGFAESNITLLGIWY